MAHHRTSHAYLFCGSRGTGKTSCAKILAKALNCLSPKDGEPCGECEACRSIDEGRAIDVIEMDAASNNGVNDIRDIRDDVAYMPAALRYRVYIIDEVHMLSDSAFNALLKTLEEPPEYIVFVLATTEFSDIPATIVSRCQRFDFRRIPTEILSSRLQVIAGAEGAEITGDGALLLARLANGGFRDAISLLEMCIAKHAVIDEKLVADTLGLCGSEILRDLVRAVAEKDIPTIFRIMTEAESGSKDLTSLWQDLIDWYRNMLVIKTVDDPERFVDVTRTELEMLRSSAALFDLPRLLYHSRLLDGALTAMKKAGTGKRNLAELTLIRMSDPALSDDCDSLLVRLTDVENRLLRLQNGSVFTAASVSAPADSIPESPVDTPPHPEEPPEQSVSFPAEESVTAENVLWWDEAIEKIASMNSSSGGFLKESHITPVQDGFLITVRGKTSQIMLSRPANLAEIADVVSALCGRPVSPEKITIKAASPSTQKRPGDELFG